MTHNFRTLLASVLFSVLPLTSPVYALEVGEQAPDFTLAGLTTAVSVRDPDAKLIYLDYWASWCGPCRQSFPWMNEMQEKYGPMGLRIIAVNLDTNAEEARRFMEGKPASFTVAFDPKGQTPRQYGVKGMPSSFLISQNGTLLQRHTGFNATDKTHMERAIATALGTQP